MIHGLRSIPPRTALGRYQVLPQSRTKHRWYVSNTKKSTQSHMHMEIMATIRTRIESLTAEITQWLPEFGEEALMGLYEERARCGEMVM